MALGLDITYYTLTDRGERAVNEDFLGVSVINGGRKLMTAQAMVNPTSVLNCVFIMLRASGSVFIPAFVEATSGHRKLFQAPANVKIERASTEERTSGRTTLKKILRRPHPSVLAASIRSFGTSRIACRMMNAPGIEPETA